MKIKDDKTKMYEWIGFAIFVLALCLGIGGCNHLTKNNNPLIQPQITIQLGK